MYEHLFIHHALLKKNGFIQREFYVDEENATVTFYNAEIPFVLEQLAELQHKTIDQNQKMLLNRFIDVLNEIYQQNKNFYLVI